MTQADRVISTPPTNTPICQSAPGAVQLSSPPVILTSHAHAGQGVKNEPEPSRGSEILGSGVVISRRSIMNMFVSTAIVGTAVPAVAAEPDPIFALIQEHKKANAEYYVCRPSNRAGHAEPGSREGGLLRQLRERCAMDAHEHDPDYARRPLRAAILH